MKFFNTEMNFCDYYSIGQFLLGIRVFCEVVSVKLLCENWIDIMSFRLCAVWCEWRVRLRRVVRDTRGLDEHCAAAVGPSLEKLRQRAHWQNTPLSFFCSFLLFTVLINFLVRFSVIDNMYCTFVIT